LIFFGQTVLVCQSICLTEHAQRSPNETVRHGGGERSKDSGAEMMGSLMIITKQKCKPNYPVGEKT